jgi:hypothetical protein
VAVDDHTYFLVITNTLLQNIDHTTRRNTRNKKDLTAATRIRTSDFDMDRYFKKGNGVCSKRLLKCNFAIGSTLRSRKRLTHHS